MTGGKLAASLDRHAPDDVIVVSNRRYGSDPDKLLDVFRPAGASGSLPRLLWVHGGFVGRSKDELAGYFRLLVHAGYVVTAPRYSLAPGGATPVRSAR